MRSLKFFFFKSLLVRFPIKPRVLKLYKIRVDLLVVVEVPCYKILGAFYDSLTVVVMATTLPPYLSTTALPLQNSSSSPTALSKMISPSDSTTSASEDSKLTSESSVPLNSSKLLEEKGQNPETLPGMVTPEEPIKFSEDDDTLVIPLETSHSRVRQECVSVETLRTYHIDHYIDIVRNHVILLNFHLTFDRTQST
jgi:hypothetical protein